MLGGRHYIDDIEWATLIDYLKSNTKLRELSFAFSYFISSKERVTDLVEVLKDQTELTTLDLGFIESPNVAKFDAKCQVCQ